MKREGSTKDDKLGELVDAVAAEKSLREEAMLDCLRLSAKENKLQEQLAGTQADASAYKRRLHQSHHELQMAESNCMEEWSAGFYAGFDTAMEAVGDKFSSVDLSSIKAEDYAIEVGAEVGSPLAAKVLDVGLGGANSEAVAEGEGTSGLIPAPVTADSPSHISGISLANPPAVAVSLASIDQAALSLMVISGGGLEGQSTPTLQGKETMEEDAGKPSAVAP